MGGERDRDEAPGPDGGPAPDPRPLRQRPREPRRPGRPGRDLDPGRGDVPRPAPSRAQRRRRSRSTRGRPTRWPWPSGPAAGSSPARRCSSRRRSAADAADEEGEGGTEGTPLESTGERVVDPRLDIFRDFVNSLDIDPETGEGRTRPQAASRIRRRRATCACHGRRAVARVGPLTPLRDDASLRRQDRFASAEGPLRFDHIRSRRNQKSRTARNTTDGLAPVAEPAVRG